MSDLQDKFKKIINDLDENIENKKDLDYIKTQIYNLSTLFIDELNKIAEMNMNRVDKIIARHKELTERMKQLEEKMNQIEEELYIDPDEDIGFEIVCPYCSTEFEVDMSDQVKSEVKCPECNNVIQLDWNQEDEGCSGHCGHCKGNCKHDEDEEDEDM